MASGDSSSLSSMMAGLGMGRCAGCFEDPSSLLSVESILQCQKVSDFLIALAYFSIPVELVCLVTCSTIFPFRWILLQFGCFIVFCGLTHFVTVFTFSPHSFLVFLALTVFKFLTALVSVATAVTLLTLIPQLLRVLVREGLLRKKTHDLDREVEMLKRREEASWHVRMLTREIRRSLDQNTILYTTLVELSKVLFLEHCAIWMPLATEGELSEDGSLVASIPPHYPPTSPTPLLRRPRYMVLTHEMKRGDLLLHPHIIGSAAARGPRRAVTAPMDDPDVSEVTRRDGAVLLGQSSCLVCQGDGEQLAEAVGTVAAVRLPLLKAADFKSSQRSVRGGGDDQQPPYAILVLALANEGDGGGLEVEEEHQNQQRQWNDQELEMVEAVADQVAVALSHAAVLEDSLAVRKQLMERNAALKQAQKEVEMAECARVLFRQVMSREMAAPVRSAAAFLSMLQLEQGLRPEQRALVKGGFVLSSLVEDATVLMEDSGELELRLRPVVLKDLFEEIRKMAKLMCSLQGASLDFHVHGAEPDRRDGPSWPDWVVSGDERRILHAVLYMAGSLSRGKFLCSSSSMGGEVVIRVNVEEEEQPPQALWKTGGGLFKGSFVKLWLQVSTGDSGAAKPAATASPLLTADEQECDGLIICRKLAQLMNGELSTPQETSGLTTILQIRLKLHPQIQLKNEAGVLRPPRLASNPETALDQLRGMKVLLADTDARRRSISQQVLRRPGCDLQSAASWGRCLEILYLNKGSGTQVLLIDLAMLEEDGQGGSGRIQKLRAQSSLLVIALVGRRKGPLLRGAQSGLHGPIGAPIVLQELLELLQQIGLQMRGAPALL